MPDVPSGPGSTPGAANAGPEVAPKKGTPTDELCSMNAAPEEFDAKNDSGIAAPEEFDGKEADDEPGIINTAPPDEGGTDPGNELGDMNAAPSVAPEEDPN